MDGSPPDHPVPSLGILRVVASRPTIPPELCASILRWYDERGRRLAFRRTTDPYAILVSEAMAQQTQAARAAAHWERFMASFPSVQALAAATPADVLREWQGLGYDRRGMNLWRAAREIVAKHDGRVPSDLATLETLPGVGPYTARAVAALAFGIPVGAVDTNVRRVLGRIVAGDPAAVHAPEMQAIADAAVPTDRPGAWTHALMDIGATLCRSATADCHVCPAARWCRSAADGGVVRRQRTRPTRAPAPFPSTTRWLRGRVMDRLRAVPGDGWVIVEAPIGTHDRAAVDRALVALSADGLIEVDGGRRARLRIA
jgi:A/G-specific adenine glycosylase